MNKILKNSLISILSVLGMAISFSSAYSLVIKEEETVSFGITQAVEESTVHRFYFTNSWSWSNVYAYIWNNTSQVNKSSWPGETMTYLYNNEYNQSVYYVDVDMALYDYIIFTNNSGNQTVDISLTDAINGGYNAYYISGGSGNSITVGTWTYQS